MRRVNQLTAIRVGNINKPGMYADGHGLYLQVKAYETKEGPALAKSWLFRYALHGRARYMGLGAAQVTPLLKARERAAAARDHLHEGNDPIDVKLLKGDVARAEAGRRITFKAAAERYIAAHAAGWKNSRAQWEQSLSTYVFPTIGNLPVDQIDVPHVLKVLEPIWNSKTETASRVRNRIERILAWATVHKYRSGDNPAAWRGNLKEALPAPRKLQTVEHYAALSFSEVPSFLLELRRQDNISARALEFAVLTAARTGEVVSARWDEIDFKTSIWTVPAERMKAGKEHRVPLSKQAISVLEALPRHSEFIFPGRGGGLVRSALRYALSCTPYENVTPHGFRSAFKDWATERSSYPREIVEIALAHSVGSKTEQAYARGDLLAKRSRLMQAWADHCSTPVSAGTVVSINRAAR